jgi:hypothetical protein
MPRPVKIPVPESANHLWKIFGNRQYKTKAYRDWLEYTAQILRERMAPVEGPVRITITIRFGKGFMRSRDLDNCFKPIIDVLKPPRYDKEGKLSSDGAGIIPDDSIETVRSIAADVEPAFDKKSEAECWVLVEPYPFPPLVPIGAPRAKKVKPQEEALL